MRPTMTAVDSAIVEFDLSTNSFKTLSFNELKIDYQDDNKLYWIHCNLNQDELFKQWITTLKLPDQLVSLCENEDPIPNINACLRPKYFSHIRTMSKLFI
jgi:magnesium transporter